MIRSRDSREKAIFTAGVQITYNVGSDSLFETLNDLYDHAAAELQADLVALKSRIITLEENRDPDAPMGWHDSEITDEFKRAHPEVYGRGGAIDKARGTTAGEGDHHG